MKHFIGALIIILVFAGILYIGTSEDKVRLGTKPPQPNKVTITYSVEDEHYDVEQVAAVLGEALLDDDIDIAGMAVFHNGENVSSEAKDFSRSLITISYVNTYRFAKLGEFFSWSPALYLEAVTKAESVDVDNWLFIIVADKE